MTKLEQQYWNVSYILKKTLGYLIMNFNLIVDQNANISQSSSGLWILPYLPKCYNLKLALPPFSFSSVYNGLPACHNYNGKVVDNRSKLLLRNSKNLLTGNSSDVFWMILWRIIKHRQTKQQTIQWVIGDNDK